MRCPCSTTPTEILGAESGYRQDRLPGRRGPRTSGRSGPTWPCTEASGSTSSCRPRHGAGAVARRPGSTTSPSSPTSRGVATATGTRRPRPSPPRRARGGAGIRQHSAVVGRRGRGRPRSSASAWPTATASVPARSSLAAGPWSVALAAAVGVDLPIRAQRAQILLVDPGRAHAAASRSSPTWCRCSTCAPKGPASLLVGDSDHSDPEWADPDALPRAGRRRRAGGRPIPKFEHRFPGLDGAPLSSSYAGCYDVTPDYNPVISACPGGRPVALRRLLGSRLQDLPVGRRAHGRPHRGRAQPPPRRRPPGLPLGALRRWRTPREPPPLRSARARCAEPTCRGVARMDA